MGPENRKNEVKCTPLCTALEALYEKEMTFRLGNRSSKSLARFHRNLK